MFNLHRKNEACSMFWLRPICPRYGNQVNDQRLMFLKKGVGVWGRFSGQNRQIRLLLYNLFASIQIFKLIDEIWTE